MFRYFDFGLLVMKRFLVTASPTSFTAVRDRGKRRNTETIIAVNHSTEENGTIPPHIVNSLLIQVLATFKAVL